MPHRIRLFGLFIALLAVTPSSLRAQEKPTRQQKVLADREKVLAEGFWIYNDLDRGLAEARQTGRPLLVALRCLPCEQCVKLDEELIEQHAEVRPLLDQFVRVRLVAANNLDLRLFQFDTDQSFAVFFLNAEGTIYGRFGTRSDQIQWADDVSIEGLARAMEGALELHRLPAAERGNLVGKRGPAPEFSTPHEFPKFREKYTAQLQYEGNVVQSCIHCHMIGDAQRQAARDGGGILPEELLFPHPHPRAVGLTLDPQTRGTVRRVAEGSAASRAGLQPGDELRRLNNQPILSMADVQWVLHRIPAGGGRVTVQLLRSGESKATTLELPRHWRRADDIAWRASSWELRRMAVGGLYFKELDDAQREKLGLPADRTGLYLQHAGKYAPHDQGHKAGFLEGDLLVRFAGQTFRRETDLLRYALNEIPVGDSVEVEVERKGTSHTFRLEMRR
ncbi:MAG: Trx7/PDZ domain-containing (seleno)protein [Planctomycetaceae bacterium]